METATFARVVRGYDPDEVDSLLLRVAERYEAMWQENRAMRQRVDELEEATRRREDEDGLMTRVLTNAHATAAEITAAAQKEAERTIEDARRNAEEARTELAERLRRAAAEIDTAEDLTPDQQLAYRDLLLTTITRLEPDSGDETEAEAALEAKPEHPAIPETA